MTVLLIKQLEAKKVNLTGKCDCMRFFFVGYIVADVTVCFIICICNLSTCIFLRFDGQDFDNDCTSSWQFFFLFFISFIKL